jgi:PAS domain S-box-containing protein
MNSSADPHEDHLHHFDRGHAGMAVVDADGTVVRANQAFCDLLGRDRQALLGSAWRELHDLGDQAGATETLLDLRTGGVSVHQARRGLRHGDGRTLELLVTTVPMTQAQGDGRSILVHLSRPGAGRASSGNGRRDGAAANGRGDGDRDVRAAREATRAALGQRVLDGLELDPLMGEVVRSVADSLRVGHVAVLELRPGALVLRLRAAVGWDGDRLAQLLLSGPALVHLQSPATVGTPTLLPDLLGEAAATTLAAEGIQAGAVATIRWAGEPVGVLAAYATTRHTLAPDDLEFLQRMADLLAAGIDHSRGQARARRQASEQEHRQERAELVTALHEGPVQNFAVLSLRLEQARLHLAQGRLDATERLLAQLQEGMADQIAGLRRLLRDLRPDELDGELARAGGDQSRARAAPGERQQDEPVAPSAAADKPDQATIPTPLRVKFGQASA